MADQYGFRPELLSQNPTDLPYPPSDLSHLYPSLHPRPQDLSYPNEPYPSVPYPPEVEPDTVSTPSPPYSPQQGFMPAYYWVDTTSRGHIPSTAVLGGTDSDGTQIYVGRAFHEGDWIPAKVIPEKDAAYIAYGGEEHSKDTFQVLCEQKFDWVQNNGGNVPPDSVEGGRTSDGEILYVGRVNYADAWTVGKVQPSHGVCYIPYDGKELSFPDYEILVLRG